MKVIIVTLTLLLLCLNMTSAAINEVFPQNVTFCGDKLCQTGEDPLNCWGDCQVNQNTLITCLVQDVPQQACNWNQSWFPPALLALVLIIFIARSIYVKKKGKKE